ncbi:MAG: diadenylate cyclase [Bryobacteraceae bacterium]|jgi:DNA integrity scanning protein DisA with diadenylate cyclase activity
MFESVLCQLPPFDPAILEPLIELAVEIAREGREGRRIGTIFTVGDERAVLAKSRPLILDPLAGHTSEDRSIHNPNLRGTIKELAQLDGAFVVSDNGVFEAACRYLDAAADGIDVPLGLGSRHVAGASITRSTRAVAIVVSQSAVVRLFCHGDLVAEILPELWMLDRHQANLRGAVKEERFEDLAVVTPRFPRGVAAP